jgi:hypothetical protein
MFEKGSENTDEDCSFPPDFSSAENQEARAFLRERFLRAVTGIVGM